MSILLVNPQKPRLTYGVALLGTAKRAVLRFSQVFSCFLEIQSPYSCVASLYKPVSQRSLTEIPVWAANLLSSVDQKRKEKKNVLLSPTSTGEVDEQSPPRARIATNYAEATFIYSFSFSWICSKGFREMAKESQVELIVDSVKAAGTYHCVNYIPAFSDGVKQKWLIGSVH